MGVFDNILRLCFLSNVCFECVGKKSESVKSPLQGLKKKASRIPSDSVHSVNSVQNSKKETVDGSVKEKKISEKTRQFVEVDNQKKYKHFDRTKHLQYSKSQDSKALVKDASKKQRVDNVDPQQLQKDVQTTKKMNDDGDLLKEHPVSVPECPDNAKKRKLCDADGKWTETCVDTTLSERSHVEYQNDRNSRAVPRENGAKVQLLERHERPDEKVVRKASVEVKTEPDDRDSSKAADVEKLSNTSTRKNVRSTDSARQHVRHGLHRAMSSR